MRVRIFRKSLFVEIDEMLLFEVFSGVLIGAMRGWSESYYQDVGCLTEQCEMLGGRFI
ncbi:hypothetical protein [Bartonella tribocorum]|uniref:hypothetical protein n=1 Tax=Bartonella tribocorum TaxID=85701 RepID=UPI00236249A5|nr:hypothetical protein [Bartonella tribocorum]